MTPIEFAKRIVGPESELPDHTPDHVFDAALLALAQDYLRCVRPEARATTAEEKLVSAGVFAGMDGLRDLANAHEFWREQPYGTRFYYGPGGGQYLHRSVLEAAIKLLDGAFPPRPPEEWWIPVSERLPEDGSPVVIVEPHATWGDEKLSEGGVMSFAIFKGGEFKVDRMIGSNANASHWMPLPPLPQPQTPEKP